MNSSLPLSRKNSFDKPLLNSEDHYDLKKCSERTSMKDVLQKCSFKTQNKEESIFRSIGFYTTLSLGILSIIGAYTSGSSSLLIAVIQKFIKISNGTLAFALWRDIKVEALAHIYVFNYTNAEAAMAGKEKPIVKEVGPYVFRFELGKTDVSFDGPERVTYAEQITSSYMKEYSNGSLDDVIYSPNILLICALNVVRKMNAAAQLSFSTVINNLKFRPLWKVSLHDIMYGYDEKINFLRDLLIFFDPEAPPSSGLIGNIDYIANDRITISTGVPDLQNRGIIQQYNGKEKVDDWFGDECNDFKVFDGSMFPSDVINSNKKLYFYRRLLCRKLPLEFHKYAHTPQGYPVKRYILSNNTFTSGDVNPENKCFCDKKCPPSGIFDVGPCYYGAPMFFSNPHFLHGNETLLEDVLGLNPDPEKHTFFMDIHDVGVLLNAEIKMQFGVTINKARYVGGFSGFKEGIALPVAWMDLRAANLTGFPNTMMYLFTYATPVIQKFLQLGFSALFVALLFRLFYCYLFRLIIVRNVISRRYLSPSLMQRSNDLYISSDI